MRKEIFESEEEARIFLNNVANFTKAIAMDGGEHSSFDTIFDKIKKQGYIKKSPLEEAKGNYYKLVDNEERTMFTVADTYIVHLEKALEARDDNS